eukprot:54071-Amphidinium_carterae.1
MQKRQPPEGANPLLCNIACGTQHTHHHGKLCWWRYKSQSVFYNFLGSVYKGRLVFQDCTARAHQNAAWSELKLARDPFRMQGSTICFLSKSMTDRT